MVEAGKSARGARGRRRVVGTAVAAAAVAVLTGSQAPGAAGRDAVGDGRGVAAEGAVPPPGDAYYFTALPPLEVRGHVQAAKPARGGAVPATVFDAYRRAEDTQAQDAPGCHLRWQLLAAIGQVESGQARGGRVNAAGTTYAPIVGPRLDGNGFALIRDTDQGRYDGDLAYDRAVGPMQFIPSTWAGWGADGNGDGLADPHNAYDAALAAGRYLCAGGRDLAEPGDLDRAVLAYNPSREYLRLVLSWFGYFRDGHRVVPDASAGGTARPGAAVGGTRPSAPGPADGRAPEPAPTDTTAPAPAPTPSATPPGTPSAPPSREPEPSGPAAPPLVTVDITEVPAPSGGVLPGAGALTRNG
ncbi:lytic transglycosylase domain-containing protein [Streptomyces coeruleoprunus]|uniref:Lytic transglycosylase domain-containing protein n=1 Tax=Streptomyces coeruleoprunus TaxID=285563 RepID=A0ABV9XDI4_9ACTN